MAIYTYSAQAIIIVGAGTDNSVQDAIKTGFVINADTGRITINGTKLEAENGLTNEQKQVIVSLLEGKISSAEFDDFKFADRYGNSVARISKEGIRTIGLKITNTLGRVIGSLNNKTCSKIFGFPFSDFIRHGDNDSFLFTDKNGNTVAKIDSQGIHSIAFYDKNNNKIG